MSNNKPNTPNNNTNNENNSSGDNRNTENNDLNISELSTPTRFLQEREFEQRRHRQQDILLMKSNKMFKRCCCYVLILCVYLLLPGNVAAATATDAMMVTTDAPPPKRLTTAAEILQLPHAFRHEEHYSHRIEQAVNDFKRAQLQQLKERDKYPTTKTPLKLTDKGNGNGNGNDSDGNDTNNKNKNQKNLPQPWQFEQHHRRHEQHYLQRNEQRQHQLQPEHHLRHSKGQYNTWDDVAPPMRHQKHQLKQGIFPLSNVLRGGLDDGRSAMNQHSPSFAQANVFRDDFDDNDDFDNDSSDDGDGDGDDDDDVDGDSDDNSFDDDSDESVGESREFIHQNSFPPIGNSYSAMEGKAASVKRYTNPFNNFKTSTKKRRTFYDIQKAQRNSDGSYKATGDEHVDGTNNDDSDSFTDEEWQIIKDKHYREKQLHALSQRESQKRESTKVNNIPEVDLQRKSIRQKYRKLAGLHHKRAREETICRVPQRRVVRVPPEPSKTYTPHCIILHRCADDTGCCQSEGKTCAPKTTEEVHLYFSVSYMQKKKEDYVRMPFINHTECHCVDKLKPDELLDNALTDDGTNGTNPGRRGTAMLNCVCPKLFEIIIQGDGSCRCDCSSGNSGCQWLKSGMEHFSVLDRKCILEERCKPPTCEFGKYMKKHGRCPRHNYFASNANINKSIEKQRFH